MIVRVCSVELHDTELQDCAVQADLPPWILFSDFERAEWATQILSERKAPFLPGILFISVAYIMNCSETCPTSNVSAAKEWVCLVVQLHSYLEIAMLGTLSVAKCRQLRDFQHALQPSCGRTWTAQSQTAARSAWTRRSKSAARAGCWTWQLSSKHLLPLHSVLQVNTVMRMLWEEIEARIHFTVRSFTTMC